MNELSRPLTWGLLVALVVLAGACAESETTPLYRPTNTPAPIANPTVTVGDAAPSSTPAAGAGTDSGQSGSHQGGSAPEQIFPPPIALRPVLKGFQLPTYLTPASEAPAWRSRLFVVEKEGRIQLVEKGQTRALPFLDITDRVRASSNEQGLLSVAFPSDFATSGLFYVNYTDQRGDTVVARFGLVDQEPVQGDPDSEQKILEIAQPAGNHNGGQLQFGPDSYLYIGMGDGGRAGDPWDNAQDPGALLGKMLRIDVSGTDTYRIPGDNPFTDRSDVRSEIWALGLRNPWRFSFDRATGDLYIADVGQNVYEELDFQPANSGGGENYGWDIMEGRHCFEPATDCNTEGLILPVAEYDHSLGCSVTGGYVYRGAQYPELAGIYFFADYCSGRIWGMRQAESGEWEVAQLLDTEITISSFGQDLEGELYVIGYRDGVIHQLTFQR